MFFSFNKTSANPGCMFPEAFIASAFFLKVLSFAIREFEPESEHANSSKNFASTSKRALVKFLQAIRAKAEVCEHFQIEWDHSIPLSDVLKFPSERHKSSLSQTSSLFPTPKFPIFVTKVPFLLALSLAILSTRLTIE